MRFQHSFDPTILREYDIRGIVDQTVTAVDAHAVGRTFGTLVKRAGGRKVGLCYDGRHSSSAFADALIKGLMACGLAVESYGLGPTPLVYFALHERNLDGAIAITGSHNPYDHNGIKMVMASGPVYGSTIKQLGLMAARGDVETAEGGSVVLVDIYQAYIDRLTRDYNANGQKPLKIVWDAGNGAIGAVLQRFTAQLPGEHILLFDDVDGDFPNHHPDPLVEKNLTDIKRVVAEQGCDLGIAFDGDGDRIGVVDREGTVIWPDQLLTLYAKEMFTRKPGATVILDVKCSSISADLITAWGGNPIMWKAGHSLVKAKMKETGAQLGGELSGHIFFKEGFYGHDDALYCAVRLMNVVHALGDLSELKKLFPKTYATPEIRFDVSESDKFSAVERVKDYAKNLMPGERTVIDIDGVRVNMADGWWLLRASNTESALTARAEGLTTIARDDMIESLRKALKYAGLDLPEPGITKEH